MRNLNPIKLIPAREMVASRLREAILLRELKEGDEITLEDIANQLNVSITPVREAFLELEADSFIKRRPNKSAIVLGITKKSIFDHYEVRAILEREAAALACSNDADISRIVEVFETADEILKNGDEVDYTDYNHMFHMEIWKASRNERITSILLSLWNGLSMGVRITEKEYSQISHNEHAAIVDAIKNRDADKARELMNSHIIRSRDNILTRFEELK